MYDGNTKLSLPVQNANPLKYPTKIEENLIITTFYEIMMKNKF